MKQRANELFFRILRAKKTVIDDWKGRRFEKIKLITTTEKGDLGEDFLAELLKDVGYSHVEVKKGRRGQYDISVDEKIYFEVKVATQDRNGSFQFNGIRYDRKFSHLFCLGITPDTLFYFLSRRDALLSGDYSLVPMAKGTNATFKLTRSPSQMRTFETFESDVKSEMKSLDLQPTKKG